MPAKIFRGSRQAYLGRLDMHTWLTTQKKRAALRNAMLVWVVPICKGVE